MTTRKRAEIAAELLRSTLSSEDGPPPSDEMRVQAIAQLREAIILRKKRMIRTRIAAGAGIVAFAAAIALIASHAVSSKSASKNAPAEASLALASTAVSPHLASGDVQILGRGGASTSLHQGDSIEKGYSLVSSGGAAFDYADGTRVTLGGDAELAIVETGPKRIFALEKGAVDLRVNKLHAEERLLVRTSDAEVEVRGTRFRVEIADPNASCDHGATRVVVSEGVVSVRKGGVESRVSAGETWPACATEIAARESTTSVSSAPMVTLSAPRTRGVTSSSALTSNAASSLEEQNNLFADGIDKKRSGDQAGAVRSFERLMAEHPNGALAESAAVERFKILRTTDPARAKKAAEEYLARNPHGFAREEATVIAGHREK